MLDKCVICVETIESTKDGLITTTTQQQTNKQKHSRRVRKVEVPRIETAFEAMIGGD
jgi:hypothetical protein